MSSSMASPAGRTLEVIDGRADATAWDAFLENAANSTACHLAAWDAVMENVLGHRSMRMVAVEDDGTWAAVLPLVEVRSRIFGNYLVSMPFLNDGGPVGHDRGRRRLAEAALALATERNVDLLELRGRSPMPGPLSASSRKIRVDLDLPDTVEALWENGLKSKLRSQIRRPMREGMTARFGAEQVDAFYEVFARNMRDLGTPVLPLRFFEAIATRLGAAALIGCVYHEERPIAAGFGLRWQDEVEITWASSVREFDRLAPNMLLYWRFLERAIEDGHRRFNFGRCTRDSGTHRFKRQWGGADVDLPWAMWSPDATAATPTPDGRFMRVAVRAWQRLPLGVANRLGPRVARQIP